MVSSAVLIPGGVWDYTVFVGLTDSSAAAWSVRHTPPHWGLPLHCVWTSHAPSPLFHLIFCWYLCFCFLPFPSVFFSPPGKEFTFVFVQNPSKIPPSAFLSSSSVFFRSLPFSTVHHPPTPVLIGCHFTNNHVAAALLILKEEIMLHIAYLCLIQMQHILETPCSGFKPMLENTIGWGFEINLASVKLL